jgi:hypothetical protein
MSKKKRLSLTERYLKELHLRFIEVLKYNPDFWEGLALQLSAGLEGTEEAKQCLRKMIEQHDSFESLLNAFSQFPNDKYMLYIMLAGCFGADNEHLLAAYVNPLQVISNIQGLPVGNPGLYIVFNMRYENALLSGLNDVILGHYCEPKYKVDPRWRNIYDDSDWVLETLFACPSLMEVRVNLSAGKMKIRQAVRELLDKYTPRESEPTRRFHPEKWEEAYKIYDLKLQGLSFEEIAIQIGKPLSTIHGLYKGLWEHIHQREHGTKRQRFQESGEEYPFDDANRGWGARIGGVGELEDAERRLASRGLVGGSGRRKAAHIVSRDDEAGTFFVGEDESWFTLPDWHTDCLDCKFVPGSEGCSTCSQEYPPALYVDGLLENKEPYKPSDYTKRFISPPTYPGEAVPKSAEIDKIREKESESRYEEVERLISLGVDPDEKLALQAKYIEENGATECPLKVAKNFGPRWGLSIQYWPTAPVPCAECSIDCDEICEDALRWLEKNFKPRTMRANTRKWADLVGQYNLTFTLRNDLLEWLLVNQIDQRAQKSHRK